MRNRKEFTFRKLDTVQGPIYRVLERMTNGQMAGPWLLAVGAIDWNTPADAERQVSELTAREVKTCKRTTE